MISDSDTKLMNEFYKDLGTFFYWQNRLFEITNVDERIEFLEKSKEILKAIDKKDRIVETALNTALDKMIDICYDTHNQIKKGTFKGDCEFDFQLIKRSYLPVMELKEQKKYLNLLLSQLKEILPYFEHNQDLEFFYEGDCGWSTNSECNYQTERVIHPYIQNAKSKGEEINNTTIRRELDKHCAYLLRNKKLIEQYLSDLEQNSSLKSDEVKHKEETETIENKKTIKHGQLIQICAEAYQKLLTSGELDIKIQEKKSNKAISQKVIPILEIEYEITNKQKETIHTYFRKRTIEAKKTSNVIKVITNKSS